MIDVLLRQATGHPLRFLALGLILAGSGLWSLQHLNIDAVPDITDVQVQINTVAPGYSPLEVEQRITYGVETVLNGLPGLVYTRSLSRYGLSQVNAVFEEGADIHEARNLVNTQLGAVRSVLPPEVEPEMGPISSGLGEVFMYTVSAAPGARRQDGSPWDATALREIQDWVVRPQLVQVDGVTEINSMGGFAKEYHVSPDPVKLLEHGLGLEDVVEALRANNSNRGAGYIERDGQQFLVRSPGQLGTMEDIGAVVLASRDGHPIRVREVATVAIGRELRTGAATREGEEVVLGTAMMLIGENSRTVARAVAERLDAVRLSLPEGVLVEPVYDRTLLVDRVIATVTRNLLEGALLVIVILFLLLGNLRAALITAMVIPLSMLMTVTGMVRIGVSANLMSLGALDFGLIVDGAVIIVEDSVRRLSEAHRNGRVLPLRERLATVYQATGEVIRPSLYGVAIITVVYIPIFALGGVEGKMFHPMAATVVMALLSAMLLSLTVVPAAVAFFLRGPVRRRENLILRVCRAVYRPALMLALRLRWLVLLLSALLVAWCVWLATTLGSEFIPQLDEGDIALHAARIPGTGIEQSVEMQMLVEERLRDFPEVERVFSRTGTAEVATDPMPPNISDTFVMLRPRGEWPDPSRPKEDLVHEMEHVLLRLPGNNYEFTQPIEMRFNELISGVRTDLGIKVFGDDLEVLLSLSRRILEEVLEVHGAADARVEQMTGLPTLSVVPDRTALSRYGLDVADLQEWVSTAIGGQAVGTLYRGDRRFPIVVRLPEALRREWERLGRLPLALPGGDFVPLEEVARVEMTPSPAQIRRENGKRCLVVTANVRDRDLGSFVEEVRARIRAEVDLPEGYWVEYGGTFEQLELASRRLSIVVPLVLGIILGILMIAFSSLRDALIIFTGVPLALTGGVLSLWIRGMPLSISAGIGFIALSGIAVLNGVVLVSFFQQWLRESGDPLQAILQGTRVRLRPVLMTAAVTSIGFFPMAFHPGAGAEVQQPLATVVIGGVLSSTLLTLFVVPILYQLTHRSASRST